MSINLNQVVDSINMSELKTLIESDVEALAFANSGNWKSCAERCTIISPPVLVETLLTELGILRVFSNPIAAENLLQKIELVAQNNPLVARVLKWLRPGSNGVDFGNITVRTMLVTPVEQGGVGLTQEEVAELLSSAEKPKIFTPIECRVAMIGA